MFVSWSGEPTQTSIGKLSLGINWAVGASPTTIIAIADGTGVNEHGFSVTTTGWIAFSVITPFEFACSPHVDDVKVWVTI